MVELEPALAIFTKAGSSSCLSQILYSSELIKFGILPNSIEFGYIGHLMAYTGVVIILIDI